MVLESTDLEVGYGESTVIKGLSLTCDEDEILAILGRNGMGKTTLLKGLMGVLPTGAGTIKFEGEEITDLPSHDRARRGMTLIPQGRDIFPELTVRENLKMGQFAAEGRDPLEMEAVFEYFPILEERLSQEGGKMSGGQQQMLAIARGLITNPDLILLDEPSEGIQPSIVKDIGEIISTIHKEEGIPIIIVEQNIKLVEEVAERGYILENGRIVEEGNIQKLDEEGHIQDHIGV